MAADYSPGFYKTNFRAVSLGEIIRARGLGNLLVYVKRFWFRKREHGYWMPRLFADSECSPEELSPRFWEATAFKREILHGLGFTEYALTRIKPHHNLSPALREHGQIRYVHSNRSHLAVISFLRVHVPGTNEASRGKVNLHFSAAFANRVVSYGDNNRPLVDPSPGIDVFRVQNVGPQFLYQHFTNHLTGLGEKPLTFPDNESLRRWLDERQIAAFRHRVDRGIFVKMTDAEVEKFRRNMPANA